MDEIEVPKYFMCPISLQIMKDPVTTMTGITYDRENIEKWLSTANQDHNNNHSNDHYITCPVTKQYLPTDLTPNHTLRRLIQAWCVAIGVDRIPTPKPLLDRQHVIKLVRDLLRVSKNNNDNYEILKKIEALATESEQNRKLLAEGGAIKAVVAFFVKRFKDRSTSGIEEALRILHLIWVPNCVDGDVYGDFFESLAWILGFGNSNNNNNNEITKKGEAVKVLRLLIEDADSSRLERLRPELFADMIGALRELLRHSMISSLKSTLQCLIEACPWGRNRVKMIEAGAVVELLELELTGRLEGKATELVFSLLALLCDCADGRAQFVGHAGGMAVVAKRIMRVSAATDDRAIHVLSQIARFSAKSEVMGEMLAVGAVTKLCMVLQADCEGHLKDKARGILRLHSKKWSDSPCIAVYLMSRPHN